MRELTLASLLNTDAFEAIRANCQQEIIALKKKRRLSVGPFAIFHFECYETLWWQIQEMVRIEKGGPQQQQEELMVYQPLLPQGSDWRVTLMFEIPDVAERRRVLQTLGHIEQTLILSVEDILIRAEPLELEDVRTTEEGKTSAVHFLKFPFSPEAKQQILKKNAFVSLAFKHPFYHHQITFSESLLETLRKDLSK